jgi:lactoylglutathione lyase
VPFFGVNNMETSLRFYVDGLGFKMKHWWIPERVEDNPDRRIRWCWLELGDAAVMLQEFLPERLPKQTRDTDSIVLPARPAAIFRGCKC